ncbi:MAG: efflux transporter outer membrane subunit [Deltaproteobacteria bacterium]|nr:MAG: efflux transporter outer membrane subunit [Deltaproteobacteria bacterium]
MCFSGARRPRGSPRASGRPSARRRAWRGGRLESLGVGSAGRSRGRPRLSVVAVAVLAACALGPSYRRPVVPTPETTRGQHGPADPASLADSPWWAIFRNPALPALVEEAIRQIAVARADMFPQVSYQGEAVRERTAVPGIPANLTFNSFLGTFNLAWEIDVWGRIRRATEAARADYLAAEAVRRGVLLTLVSDVAQAYFELLELDRELEITQGTRITFQDTVDLFQRRYVGGIGTLLEVSRAQAALTQARAGIPELERQIVVKENQLSTLLGRPPGEIARGASLDGESPAPEVPAGLPSQLLERRPDIQQAEQALVAANADVGVAVASFFPRLGLTSLYGGQSSELENVVKSAGNVWAIGGSLAGPLFQGGRLLASYRASSAGWDEAVERYQQATLRAFAEVSNALVAQQKLKGVHAERDETVKALQTSVALSLQRYNDGIASYFEVLEAEQQLFPAELDLARTQRDELVAVVTLYRALGGGWRLAVPDWSALPDKSAGGEKPPGE